MTRCVIRESTAGGAISVAAIASVARYDTSPEIRERAVGGRPWKGQLNFYKFYRETFSWGATQKWVRRGSRAMDGSSDGKEASLQDPGG